jgi:hypothetical protein
VNSQTDPFKISITVEGRQFWIDGGYKKSFEEIREKYSLEKSLLKINISTNEFLKTNNIIQLVISILVGIFVILSALYQIKTYTLEVKSKSIIKETKLVEKDTLLQGVLQRLRILEFNNKKHLDSIKTKNTNTPRVKKL